MSRLGSASNLFGNLYRDDRDRTTSVFNQNPTGRAGQAASFAAAQQSELDKQNRQRQEAIAAATAQQQAVSQEATAAQQRQETARTEAFREQEFKLAEAKFQNQKAVELQQVEEQKRAAFAQNAFQQNQQRSVQPSSTQAQRAQGGERSTQCLTPETLKLGNRETWHVDQTWQPTHARATRPIEHVRMRHCRLRVTRRTNAKR